MGATPEGTPVTGHIDLAIPDLARPGSSLTDHAPGSNPYSTAWLQRPWSERATGNSSRSHFLGKTLGGSFLWVVVPDLPGRQQHLLPVSLLTQVFRKAWEPLLPCNYFILLN